MKTYYVRGLSMHAQAVEYTGELAEPQSQSKTFHLKNIIDNGQLILVISLNLLRKGHLKQKVN
jgi:hypothetical protein